MAGSVCNNWISVGIRSKQLVWTACRTQHSARIIADICHNHTTGSGVLFPACVLLSIENPTFLPILASFGGYFVANLRTFWCTFYRHKWNGVPKLTNIRYEWIAGLISFIGSPLQGFPDFHFRCFIVRSSIISLKGVGKREARFVGNIYCGKVLWPRLSLEKLAAISHPRVSSQQDIFIWQMSPLCICVWS